MRRATSQKSGELEKPHWVCLCAPNRLVSKYPLSGGDSNFSAGRPLITLMSPEAELARLVKESGCGWNVTNAQELVELVRRLLADPEELDTKRAAAQETYTKMFQREGILDRYAEILKRR